MRRIHLLLRINVMRLVLATITSMALAITLDGTVPGLAQTAPASGANVPAGRPPAGGGAGHSATSSTTFLCGKSGNNPATLVQVSGRTLQSPLIIWQTNYFGSDYTPEQRCQTVSLRLSNAVSQNGGRLSNLRLASGTVNNQTVICYTNGAGNCNTTNMLFTLRPENASNPRAVLENLMNFASKGSGGAVYESGGIDSGGEDVSINLEEVINQAIQAEANATPDAAAQPSEDVVPSDFSSTPSPYPASPEAGSYPGGI